MHKICFKTPLVFEILKFCTWKQKNNCIPPIVFEILKFQNPAMWLADIIFAFNSQFYQHHKGHYGVWFKPKKSTLHGLLFLQDQKSPIFGVFQKKYQKKFQKNPMSRFRQNTFTYWHNDILTSWQWWNHRTPFHLKAGVQKDNSVYLQENKQNTKHKKRVVILQIKLL